MPDLLEQQVQAACEQRGYGVVEGVALPVNKGSDNGEHGHPWHRLMIIFVFVSNIIIHWSDLSMKVTTIK